MPGPWLCTAGVRAYDVDSHTRASHMLKPESFDERFGYTSCMRDRQHSVKFSEDTPTLTLRGADTRPQQGTIYFVPLYTRSSARRNLLVPRTRRRLGSRTFCVAGPTAWNSLPTDIRTASTLANCKQHFKTRLFIRSYCETASESTSS